MKYKKTHPYTILEYIFKYIFIFILPILQQIIFYYYNILNYFILNIIFTFIFLIFCILKYKSIAYYNSTNMLIKKNGIFIKNKFYIPYNNIHLLIIKKTIFSVLFCSSKLKLDIPSKNSKKSDISLNLSKNALDKSVNYIFHNKNIINIYKASNFSIFLMALSWSNSAAGLLLAAPFIKRIGLILGKEFEQKLYLTFDFSVYLAAIGIPPLTAWITYILVYGFIISLMVQLLRYFKFKVSTLGENIVISRGLLSINKIIFNKKNLNSVFIKQTLLMKIFKLYSAYINTINFKKEKGDHSMLFAAASYKNLKQSIYKLLNISISKNLIIKSPKKAIKSFLITPLLLLLIVVALFLIIILNLYYNEIYNLIFIFLSIILIWWLALKFFAFKTSGISLYPQGLILHGYKNLSLISAIVPYSKIQFISVNQNLFQKLSGLCNIKVFIYSEKAEHITVKYLNYFLTNKLVNSLYNSTN